MFKHSKQSRRASVGYTKIIGVPPEVKMGEMFLNRKIHNFRKAKEEELPDLKKHSVDEIIRELQNDPRSSML
jgi:hypothetical protein